MKKIDTHIHIGRFHNAAYGVEDLASLWEAGVEEAWGSSLSAATVGMRFGNDEMLAAVQAEPRVRGLVWVRPYDPDWRELAQHYLTAGFIGIKLHPPIDCYEPSEAYLRPVFDMAAEQNVPVFVHAHGLDLFAGFIGKYPGVPLVVYHMGDMDGIWLARQHPNVHLELSWCDSRKIFAAWKAIGAERLLFGTDAPFRLVKNPVVDLKDGVYKTYPQRGLNQIEEGVPDAAAREKILGGNARVLVGKA